jgi:hypothetical protein
LTGQKNQKPLAAIIMPPTLCTYGPARAESIAAGMLRQIKAKKQSRPGGLSWIHSDAPAANGASESVLWSRKYCLTHATGESGFGPAKVGPRQRLAGASFQSPNLCSPLFSPSRDYLPARYARCYSRFKIALIKDFSYHKPGQASITYQPKNSEILLLNLLRIQQLSGKNREVQPSDGVEGVYMLSLTLFSSYFSNLLFCSYLLLFEPFFMFMRRCF